MEQRALKDEDAAHPVASAWRPTFHKIVEALVRGDYAVEQSVPLLERVSAGTASQMKQYVADYGETLCELPAETWTASVAQWTGTHWDVLVDLWTVESGCSDMVLHALVSEEKDGFRVRIHLIFVP